MAANNNERNILIAGVGGQGTLLAAKIIGSAAMRAGLDAKVSEVHGMSQRGGSVVTYVKFSDKPVRSPIIDEGQADIVMAFEELEGYRSLPYLKKDGVMLMNVSRIMPMPVITGVMGYPGDIPAKLRAVCAVTAVDAAGMALKAGNARAVNMVLTGLLAAALKFEPELWLGVIRDTTPARFLDANLAAFRLGYDYN